MSRIFTGLTKLCHRLDKTLSQARQNFVKGMINFYHRLDNSCCYLLFFLFGLSSCLRIRGYLIKYSRIFHYASAVTRSFCFFFVVNCLHGVGFSHNAVFVFTHTNLTDLTKSSSIVGFLFHANLAKAYIACARMYHPAESTRQSRQARAKRRAICEIREICVK